MKIDRRKVWEKYGGHCAYCGEEITVKSMQVDHIWPKRLAHWQKELDPNREENLNPACRKCNNFKTGMVIDPVMYPGLADFRDEIKMQVSRLRKVSQFDRALRFGLVTITENPVQFYFEKIKTRQNLITRQAQSSEAEFRAFPG